MLALNEDSFTALPAGTSAFRHSTKKEWLLLQLMTMFHQLRC